MAYTQKLSVQDETLLSKDEGYIVANAPTNQIYDFTGYFQCSDAAGGEKEALSLENTLWSNTVLASKGHILGIVVYTGRETRA